MMAVVSREDIATAFYSLVSAAAGGVVSLKTSSRRLQSFEDVAPSSMPALFVNQENESYEYEGQGFPPKRTMNLVVWLYTCTPQTKGAIPATDLNKMVDAIETALRPSPVTNFLTLNGKAYNARISGPIRFFEDLTKDGKSAATIPVAILIP